jgi:DNA-binding MarR family transcriptional regulator
MRTPCYCAAIRAAARKTTALYDESLAPAGLNLAQYSLMRRIEHAEPISLTELARVAELDRSTVGRNVRVLERLEFARLESAEDQREAAVRLTAAGIEALRRGEPFWNEAQRRVEATLGVEHAKQLRALALAL